MPEKVINTRLKKSTQEVCIGEIRTKRIGLKQEEEERKKKQEKQKSIERMFCDRGTKLYNCIYYIIHTASLNSRHNCDEFVFQAI